MASQSMFWYSWICTSGSHSNANCSGIPHVRFSEHLRGFSSLFWCPLSPRTSWGRLERKSEHCMYNFLFLSLFWLPLKYLCIMCPKFLKIPAGEYGLIFITVLTVFLLAFGLICSSGKMMKNAISVIIICYYYLRLQRHLKYLYNPCGVPNK